MIEKFRQCCCLHIRSGSPSNPHPYLSPGSKRPLQLVVLWAAAQDAALLGFGSLVLSAHAVGHHRAGVGALAEHASLPQPAAATLGALPAEDTMRRRGETQVVREAYKWISLCYFFNLAWDPQRLDLKSTLHFFGMTSKQPK